MPPADALSGVQERLVGQVVRAEAAHIEGETVGVVLAVERTTAEQEEKAGTVSELLIVPGSDPGTWGRVVLGGGATLIAVGDVDADGNDDVAVVHQREGPPCPTPVVEQTPCGVVRVLDGVALTRGEILLIAQIDIAPVAEACGPSTHGPSSVSVSDVTGDGRADIAFGQLGAFQGKCGQVHVFSGNRLAGHVSMDEACARIVGPPFAAGQHPDMFGMHVELFSDDEGEAPYVAVGAPFASNDQTDLVGRLGVYDLADSCGGSASGGPGEPELVFEHEGDRAGRLVGADTAFADGALWAASKGRLEAFSLPGFEPSAEFNPPTAFPVAAVGDLTGDGRSELLVGARLATQEGRLLLDLGPFAQDTFRGVFIGPDDVLSSDQFGLRLWSLSDVWNPHLSIYATPQRVQVGGTVNVSVAEMISLVPGAGPVHLEALGGTVESDGPTWLVVRADTPGEILVQGRVQNTTRMVRVPVDPVPYEVSLAGPQTVRVQQPVVVRVYAPEDSSVAWQVPSGSPTDGVGRLVETRFSSPGTYDVTVRVTLPNGAVETLHHTVRAVSGPPLAIVGLTQVTQGTPVDLAVWNPDPDQTYVWQVESAQLGVATLAGPEIRIPAGGWGTWNVTVAAHDAAGEVVAAGHTQVLVENLPPVIQSLEAMGEAGHSGLAASARVFDRGGDEVSIGWFVDHGYAGSGPRLHVPDLPAGRIHLKVVAVDEGGLSATVERTVDIVDPWRSASLTQQLYDPTDPSAAGNPELWKPVERIAGQASGGDDAPAPTVGVVWVLAATVAFVWRLRRGSSEGPR